MAADTRKATRRESITVVVERLKAEFVIEPLPWRARNDFGDTVLDQYLGALNKAISTRQEGLVGKLMESEIAYDKLFEMAVPSGSSKTFNLLDFTEIMEVLGAALEVNALERQRYMLDPNLPAPTTEEEEVGASDDGQKITSLEDLSSRESDPEMN